MTAENIKTLIDDTLYFRRINPDGSCFLTNVAGNELQMQSANALPAIESVLSDVVAPNFIKPEFHPFLGLSDLLGAYLLIGANNDIVRTVRFLHTLPAALQAEVVAIVPVFFPKFEGRTAIQGIE